MHGAVAVGRMKTLLAGFAAPVFSTDVGWRIVAFANLLRLLVAPLLVLLSRMMSPPPVGEVHPALFTGVAVAYFLHAVISIGNIRRRWPDLAIQTLIYVCIDVLVISLLAYASGGVSGGLAALLILSIGAASSVVRQRLALLFAALAAIGWLVTMLAERTDDEGLLTAVMAGALIFTVTFGVRWVARILWEGREPTRVPVVEANMTGAIEQQGLAASTPMRASAPPSIELTAWLKEFVTAFWLAEEIDGRTMRLTSLAHDLEIHADPPRLYQLLWKLCGHALEHHDASLSEPIHIRVTQSTPGHHPVLEIIHRGPGLSAAEIELAAKNGIALTYERRPSGHTIFRLAFE